MDELYIIFLKERGMLRQMDNLHPRETIFSKNSLELSGLVSMTNQSFVHLTCWLNTVTEEDYNIRFEL